MQKRPLIIAGCVVFGFSLLAHLPAKLVVPQNPGKFQFTGTDGSLWQGEVNQVLFSGKALPIRNLSWKVKPAALLRGTLEADFYEQQTPTNHGNISLNLLSRELELHALHWQVPSSSMDAWISLPGMKARGQFVLDLQSLQLPANELFPSQLQGRLDWQNAELQIDSENWPIGSPVLRFSDEGDAIKGVVTSSQTDLLSDSSFLCTKESCRVELSLQTTPDIPQSVLNGLLLLGLQQTGDTFSGQFTFPLE